ncbi:MAG: pitrilysin family protein, partial [Thermodesulfobacteriota bacterium]
PRLKKPMTPTINKTVLQNGIRILTKRLPHVRSVSMGVWVNAGARDETQEENGLSHFIEHMIFKGTSRRSAFQIAKEFDAVGGHTNAFTTMENTCYHGRVMDTHLEVMIDILSDIFLNSVFDPVEVERERPVIFQEIGMLEDNPEEYIHLLSGKAFWGETALGRSILGTRENLINFNSEAIKSFFGKFYQPDRIVISAAGNVDHSYIVDRMKPAFESIQKKNGFPLRLPPDSSPKISLYRRKLEQVHICIACPGFSLADPKRFSFSLMNTVLGGNMSSRLFQEIRERRGLAYSIYSFISPHVDTGMFGIYAACDPKKTEELIGLCVTEMKKIKKDLLEETELKNAKEFIKGNLLLSSEGVDSQMVRQAQSEIYFNRDIPLEWIIEQIERVSPEEIRTLSRDIFQADRMALTLLGPVPKKIDSSNVFL